MRSFVSCQATDMEQLFWFSLLLTCLSVTESCLSEPNKVISHTTEDNVDLSCTVSSNCSHKSWEYTWFFFKTSSHPLKLQNRDKYKMDGASLSITNLQVSDSGIYYCAVVVLNEKPESGMQYVGMGTTLVVREKVKIMVRHILLWLSFVLLALYSLALVTLIVKKHGCIRLQNADKVSKHSNSTKKKLFRDVLQEMYRKKNMERSKQTVSRKRSHVETANTDFNSSIEDIYQNV